MNASDEREKQGMPLSSPPDYVIEALTGLDLLYRVSALGSAISGEMERQDEEQGSPWDKVQLLCSPHSLALPLIDVLVVKRLVSPGQF